MKPREKSMKWFMLILFVTTNCTKGEYLTDADSPTLNYEFDEKPAMHSEHVKDHYRTNELRLSRDRIMLPKISRYDERDENSNLNKLKTSRRMLPERYGNIDMRRNYSTREIREVYLEMPRFRTNKLDSSRTADLEKSLKNMNNHHSGFIKQQRKVRIYGYTTVMPDATSNARQLSENRSRDRFYVTRQNYRDNLKQGDKVSEMRYLTPVIEVRMFRQNSISASNEDKKSHEGRNRVEQNNRNRRFIRMEIVRKQNDRQQINRNRFERIQANSRDNIIHFTSEKSTALTNRFIPKTLSSIFAEKHPITQNILQITDNRQISFNRQKRNTVRQMGRIQNTEEILQDADFQRIRKFNKNDKRIAEDRHRDGFTRERTNVNIDSRQRTTEDRYRNGASRERMNVDINSRQRSAEGRHQDFQIRDRININTHSRQRIAVGHHRDSITLERIDGNINSRERTATDRLRTDSTRERINVNIHSRRKTTEDRYRDDTSRERMNINIKSRQRSAEGRHQDSITRDRININTRSRQRIAEDRYRDDKSRERMNVNINSRQRSAENRYQDSITRDRININAHSRQRISEGIYRDDTSRERMSTNINSRQRYVEDRYQDSITRDRMNINAHSRQRIAENLQRNGITREQINGNINSRERTAKDRLRTDSIRYRINANIHSRQRTAEDRYRDDTSRERMNVNINSRQRSAEGRYQDSITRDRININAHSRQRIAEDRYRDDTSRERMNVNINSRQRSAEGRYQDSTLRDRININAHSRQRIAENHERNGITREQVNGNINSRKRTVRENLARESINVNIHSRQYLIKNNEGRIGTNEIKIPENRRERSESPKLTRNRIDSQTHNQIREIPNSYQRKLMRNDRFQTISRRVQYFDKENQVVNYLPRSVSRRTDERQRNIAERSSSKSSTRKIETTQNQNRHIIVLREIDIRNSAKNTQNIVEQREINSQRNTPEKRQIRTYEISRNIEKIRNRQSMNRELNDRQLILAERSSSKSGEKRKENIQNRRMNILNKMNTQDSIKDTQGNVEQRERNSQRNTQEKRRIRSYENYRNVENIRNRQIINRESNERRMDNIQNQNRRIDVLRQIAIRNSARYSRRNVEQNERNSQRNAPEKRQIYSYEVNLNVEKIRSRQNTNRESNERQRIFAEKSSSKSSERRIDNIQNQNRRIDGLRQIDIQSSARNIRRNVELNERNSQRNTQEKREIRLYEVNRNIEKVKNRQSIKRESTERQQHILAERSSSKSSERRIENIQNQNRRMAASMDSLSQSLRTSKFSLRARTYITVPRKFIRIQLLRNKENSKRISNSNIKVKYNGDVRENEERIIKANGGGNILPGDKNVRETSNLKVYILQLLKGNSLLVRNVKSRQRENKNNYRYIRQTTLGKIPEEENREHRYSHRISENKLQQILNKDFIGKVQKDSDELRHFTELAEERIEMMTNRNVRTQRSRRLQAKHFNELSKERIRRITNINARTRTGKQLQDRHFTEASEERIRMITNKNARTQTGRKLQERHFIELSEERTTMMNNRIVRTQRSRQLENRQFTETSEERIRIMFNKNARTRTDRQFTEEKRISIMPNSNVRTQRSRQLQKRYVAELSEERIRIMTNRNVRTRTSRQLQERHFTELSKESIRMMTNRNARTRIIDAFFERKIQDVERLSIQGARKRSERLVRVNNDLIITSKVTGDQSYRKNLIADERHFEFKLRMADKNDRIRTTRKGFERNIQNRERSSVQIARKINERSVTVINGLRIISKVIGDQSYRKTAVSDERHTKLQLRMNDKLRRQARERIHDMRFLSRVNFEQESKERLMLQKRQTRLNEMSVYFMQKVSQTKKLFENIRENTAVNKRNRAGFRGKSAEPQMKSIEVLILTRQNTQPRLASKRNIRYLDNSDILQRKPVAFGSQNSHLLSQRNGRGYRGRYLQKTAERRARISSVNTRTLYIATNNHKLYKSTNVAQTSSVAIQENMYVEKLFGQKISVINTRENIHSIVTRAIISENRSRLPRRITISPKELNGPSSSRVHSSRINLGSNRRLNNLRPRSDIRNNLNKLTRRIRENRYFDNQFRNVQFATDLSVRQKPANSYDDVRKKSLPLSRQNRQQISRNSLDEVRHSIPREEMRRTRKNILRVEIREISKQENYNLLSSNSAPENDEIQKFSALEVASMPKRNIFEERKSSRIQGTQEGPSNTYTSDSQEYWKIRGNNVSSFLVNLILGFLIILATSERNEIKSKPFKERLADILFLRSSVF